ncbi:MAG: hydroxyisourate hydrolase [Pseudomonadota bacterium]
MGKLTTHILDTARGRPGAGIPIRVFRDGNLIKETVSNADGRCDEPLIDDGDFVTGMHELEFRVATYFADLTDEGKPPFLDCIKLTVTLSDDAHYHVPLLVSPWSYSTYRGS